MKTAALVTGNELGEHTGDVLADRFLYHFVVRHYALALLGESDEWGGLSVLGPGPSAGDERGQRPHRSDQPQ